MWSIIALFLVVRFVRTRSMSVCRLAVTIGVFPSRLMFEMCVRLLRMLTCVFTWVSLGVRTK